MAKCPISQIPGIPERLPENVDFAPQIEKSSSCRYTSTRSVWEASLFSGRDRGALRGTKVGTEIQV